MYTLRLALFLFALCGLFPGFAVEKKVGTKSVAKPAQPVPKLPAVEMDLAVHRLDGNDGKNEWGGKRLAEIIPPETIERIVRIHGQNSGHGDLQTQADFDALLTHAFASTVKATPGTYLASNEGPICELIFLTKGGELMHVQVLTTDLFFADPQTIVISQNHLSARVELPDFQWPGRVSERKVIAWTGKNRNSPVTVAPRSVLDAPNLEPLAPIEFVGATEFSVPENADFSSKALSLSPSGGCVFPLQPPTLPPVELGFEKRQALDWLGKQLSEIIPPASIKRIATLNGLQLGPWNPTQVELDAFLAHVFASSGKAVNCAERRMEGFKGEAMVLTTAGELFRLEFSGKDGPTAVLINGQGKGARVAFEAMKWPKRKSE